LLSSEDAHWEKRKTEEAPVRSFRTCSAFVVALVISEPGLAQKLVDPDSVAPEFRAAAEQRRAEQLALNQCTKKANDAKVVLRDRAGFINDCLDKNKQDRK
jgi:hypothetical protein